MYIHIPFFLSMSGSRVVFYLGDGPLTKENQWPQDLSTPTIELSKASFQLSETKTNEVINCNNQSFIDYVWSYLLYILTK